VLCSLTLLAAKHSTDTTNTEGEVDINDGDDNNQEVQQPEEEEVQQYEAEELHQPEEVDEGGVNGDDNNSNLMGLDFACVECVSRGKTRDMNK